MKERIAVKFFYNDQVSMYLSWRSNIGNTDVQTPVTISFILCFWCEENSNAFDNWKNSIPVMSRAQGKTLANSIADYYTLGLWDLCCVENMKMFNT